MKKISRLFLMILALGVVLFMSATSLFAAEKLKVEKNLVLIVPYTAGSASDAYAQMIKQLGEKYVDHSITIDYKPGGNASVGITYMLAQPHDGYTICLAGNNPEYNVATGQADTYDEFSYVGVGSVVSEQAVLIVPAGSPFNTLDDVIEFAKKNPGKLNWGGAQTLGYHHFFALQTGKNAGIQFNYVPYDNAGETLIAVLGKNIDIGSVNSSTALPYVESKEIKVIAQGLSKRDETTFPDVPTAYETPGLEFEKYGTPFITHRGSIAPADVPEEMLKMWDKLLEQVTSDPEWVTWVAKRFVLPAEYIMDGKQLTEFMRNNTAIVRKVYQELDLK